VRLKQNKARDRDFYSPNSEDVGPDEMRLIACGTGMHTTRSGQAALCWLLERGNGEKFIFDFWTWHGIYDSNLEAVRETYEGLLTLARDMTVWNVTDDQVVVREAFADENVAPIGTTAAYRNQKREPPSVPEKNISPDINAGKWDLQHLISSRLNRRIKHTKTQSIIITIISGFSSATPMKTPTMEARMVLPSVSITNAAFQNFWVLVVSMNTREVILINGVSAFRCFFTPIKHGAFSLHRGWNTEKAMMSFSSVSVLPMIFSSLNGGLSYLRLTLTLWMVKRRLFLASR
jgi:hypothetical protein